MWGWQFLAPSSTNDGSDHLFLIHDHHLNGDVTQVNGDFTSLMECFSSRIASYFTIVGISGQSTVEGMMYDMYDADRQCWMKNLSPSNQAMTESVLN